MTGPASEYLSDCYYKPFSGELNMEKLEQRRSEQSGLLKKASVQVFDKAIRGIRERSGDPVDFDSPIVSFGKAGLLDEDQNTELFNSLRSLIPWRKGPFHYYGVDIDSEWKSYMKWDRIIPWLPELKNKKICDIGCNNGYYMYRMLSSDPWFILGIDPVIRYYFHHRLNRKFYRSKKINFDLLGIDDMDIFSGFFDVVFCLGILYHRRHPLQALEMIHSGMKRGGTLVLESCGIPGDESHCLFPEKRYMKAPGYWFLPTASALKNMLSRTGFHRIEVFENFKLTAEEQRRTDWAIYESLEHFLDPRDSSKTVEGYPAPLRIYIRAVKK